MDVYVKFKSELWLHICKAQEQIVVAYVKL